MASLLLELVVVGVVVLVIGGGPQDRRGLDEQEELGDRGGFQGMRPMLELFENGYVCVKAGGSRICEEIQQPRLSLC